MKILETIGDTEFLSLSKTAFLCSRKVSASAVLPCYDWAIAQRESGMCVISGFHSQLEKDVFDYLIKGRQPIILALARGVKKEPEPAWKQALEGGRLLIITPFPESVVRVTEKTAAQRNALMIELADSIVVGHVNPNGILARTLSEVEKPVTYLAASR